MIVLVLATLAGALALAVRYRTEQRVAVEYLDAVKAIVDDEAVLASGLADVFTGVGDLERPVILGRLTELADESASLRAQLSSLELTAAVAEAHGFLTVAVGAWDDALGLMGESVVEVLDGADDQTGDAMLRRAFDLLRIGDRAYFGFAEALSRIEPDLLNQTFPQLEFVGAERRGLYEASVVASRLRGIFKLEGDHDVAVVVSIDPEPLVQEGNIPIVPNAEMFIINLVVSNAGNLVEERILVSLEGDPQSADVEPIMLQSIVPFLEPDASTTVTFDVSDLVVPGEIYELRAEVVITEDDSTPANNRWSLVLVRNDE